MAMTNLITKASKVPRGYDVQGAKFLYIADGIQPPMEAIAARYLPVVEEDKIHESWFTVKAGNIVAFDKTLLDSETAPTKTNQKWLVLANGGTAQTVTYAADDVGVVLDIDELEAGNLKAVAGAGAASKQIAANIPAGFAPYNFYNSADELLLHNFKLQNTVGFLCRGLIELPLDHDTSSTVVTQATLDTGHIVASGASGEPIKWINGSTSVEQIVGRAVRVDGIAARDALDKVLTVPGFRLPGTGTSGRQLHEDVYLFGTTTLVSRRVRINITLV